LHELFTFRIDKMYGQINKTIENDKRGIY
jgi:hypothetical protein